MQNQELKIDPETHTVMVPVEVTGRPTMVLVDPKKGKAFVVPLADHGDVVVKCYQGRIAGYDERKSYRFE